jgi:hypothetical protein
MWIVCLSLPTVFATLPLRLVLNTREISSLYAKPLQRSRPKRSTQTAGDITGDIT